MIRGIDTTRVPAAGPNGHGAAADSAVRETVAPKVAAAAPDARRSRSTASAEAPAGTDPSLWSVLTAEERAFFARAHALGEVTYGPGTRPRSAGLPLGGRIDVKV
jgi:hypothetical protein